MILYIKYSTGISCHQSLLILKPIVLKLYNNNISLNIISRFTITMEGNRNGGNGQFRQPSQPFSEGNKGAGVSLNVHLTVPPTTTVSQDGSHTPNTPEILNSIVNMQAAREARDAGAAASGGPFAAEFANQCAIKSTLTPTTSTSGAMDQEVTLVAPSNSNISRYNYMEPPIINIAPPINSPDAASVTSDSTLTSPMSNYASSPATTPISGPGTIQHLTSQFIKEGLKMKVKQNMGGNRGNKSRRPSSTRTSLTEGDSIPDTKDTLIPLLDSPPGGPGSQRYSAMPLLSPTDSEQSYPMDIDTIKTEDLTPDDEGRRRRRRERNKVAATKCRNKKKARTGILIRESETLTVQNQSLKSEIQKLEQEKVRLMQVLAGHDNACLQRIHNDAVEVKREGLPSPVDETEFRVPCTLPTITSPHAAMTTTSNFSQPAPTYSDSTGRITQSIVSNIFPMVSNSSSVPFNISDTNQIDGQPQTFMATGQEPAGGISVPACQPPSFDDAARFVSEIKSEENLQEDQLIQDPNQHHQALHNLQPIFQVDPQQQMSESQHDFFRAATFGYHSISEASSNFLAKRPLGHTYLDLDSRCIAL